MNAAADQFPRDQHPACVAAGCKCMPKAHCINLCVETVKLALPPVVIARYGRNEMPACFGVTRELVVALAQLATAALQEPRSLDTDQRVCFYEQEFYVLSNFSAFRLHWSGHDFDTLEQAYHWERFNGAERGFVHQSVIKAARSAHDAFQYAQAWKHDQRAGWDDMKVDKMLALLRAKAGQHEYVRRKLLQTGDRELVENSWRDPYWGWGPNRDGHNMLGKCWMTVRAEIRANGGSSA